MKEIKMQNVGVMNQKQIGIIMKQFQQLKGAQINQGDLVINVKSPKGQEVFSAARLNETTWHVRAMKGLIEQVPH